MFTPYCSFTYLTQWWAHWGLPKAVNFSSPLIHPSHHLPPCFSEFWLCLYWPLTVISRRQNIASTLVSQYSFCGYGIGQVEGIQSIFMLVTSCHGQLTQGIICSKQLEKSGLKELRRLTANLNMALVKCISTEALAFSPEETFFNSIKGILYQRTSST